jgi:hypothetical protein
MAPDAPTLRAKVIRYDVKKLAVGQILLSVGAVSFYALKHAFGPAGTAPSLIILTSSIVFFALGRRSLGWRDLRARNGELEVANGQEPRSVVVKGPTRWTLDGLAARLYGDRHTWRIRAAQGQEMALRDLLTPLFGTPILLQRRGSPRARAIALLVACAGVVLTTLAAALELTPLIFAGVPCAIFGLATFGALSQKAGNV